MLSHLDTIAVAGTYGLLGLLELAGALRSRRRRDDWLIELGSLAQLAAVIKPMIVLTAAVLLSFIAPIQRDVLSSTPLWLGVLVVLIPGDFMHYWYHRKGHEWGWLWRMHRTHHTAPAMGVTVAFRENWQWFAFMPDLWYAAAMTYFGLGPAVIISTLIVGVHNILIHSSTAWDRPIYRFGTVAWVMERLFQLPSTHRAHHAETDAQGNVPMENYGLTLFLWDTIFRTARFPRGRDPERYGIPNDPLDPWTAQLWWPLVRSPKHDSPYNTRSYLTEPTPVPTDNR